MEIPNHHSLTMVSLVSLEGIHKSKTLEPHLGAVKPLGKGPKHPRLAHCLHIFGERSGE